LFKVREPEQWGDPWESQKKREERKKSGLNWGDPGKTIVGGNPLQERKKRWKWEKTGKKGSVGGSRKI